MYSRDNAENRYVRREGKRNAQTTQNHPSSRPRDASAQQRSRQQVRRASTQARNARPSKRTMLKHTSYQGSPYTVKLCNTKRRKTCGVLQRRGFMVAWIMLLSLIVIGSMTWCGSQAAKHAISSTSPTSAVSTPQSEWKKGSIPYLYQTDLQWSQTPYAQDTLELSGCGPTCLSMVYIGLTGDTRMDPVACARYAERNDYIEGGATRWSLMEEGAQDLGLMSEGVPVTKQAIEQALAQGKPLIVSVSPGDFTKVGHFLVIEALDSQGKLVIHDPNSPQNSSQHWEVERVVGQTRGAWAFSA